MYVCSTVRPCIVHACAYSLLSLQLLFTLSHFSTVVVMVALVVVVVLVVVLVVVPFITAIIVVAGVTITLAPPLHFLSS